MFETVECVAGTSEVEAGYFYRYQTGLCQGDGIDEVVSGAAVRLPDRCAPRPAWSAGSFGSDSGVSASETYHAIRAVRRNRLNGHLCSCIDTDEVEDDFCASGRREVEDLLRGVRSRFERDVGAATFGEIELILSDIDGSAPLKSSPRGKQAWLTAP